MKYILSLFSLIVIYSFWGCEKNNDSRDINVYGYIHSKSDTSLFRNTEFIIYVEKGSTIGSPRKEGDDKIYHFTTDSNGHFDVIYSFPPGYKRAGICLPSEIKPSCGVGIANPVPEPNQSIDMGHIFF